MLIALVAAPTHRADLPWLYRQPSPRSGCTDSADPLEAPRSECRTSTHGAAYPQGGWCQLPSQLCCGCLCRLVYTQSTFRHGRMAKLGVELTKHGACQSSRTYRLTRVMPAQRGCDIACSRHNSGNVLNYYRTHRHCLTALAARQACGWVNERLCWRQRAWSIANLSHSHNHHESVTHSDSTPLGAATHRGVVHVLHLVGARPSRPRDALGQWRGSHACCQLWVRHPLGHLCTTRNGRGMRIQVQHSGRCSCSSFSLTCGISGAKTLGNNCKH